MSDSGKRGCKERDGNKYKEKKERKKQKVICYRLQEMRERETERDGKDHFILIKTPCGV